MESQMNISDQRLYNLEYNPTQGHFHHNHGNHPANTNDWVTIAESVSDLKLSVFSYYMIASFGDPILYNGKPLTTDKAKEEWKKFSHLFNAFTTAHSKNYPNQDLKDYLFAVLREL